MGASGSRVAQEMAQLAHLLETVGLQQTTNPQLMKKLRDARDICFAVRSEKEQLSLAHYAAWRAGTMEVLEYVWTRSRDVAEANGEKMTTWRDADGSIPISFAGVNKNLTTEMLQFMVDMSEEQGVNDPLLAANDNGVTILFRMVDATPNYPGERLAEVMFGILERHPEAWESALGDFAAYGYAPRTAVKDILRGRGGAAEVWRRRLDEVQCGSAETQQGVGSEAAHLASNASAPPPKSEVTEPSDASLAHVGVVTAAAAAPPAECKQAPDEEQET